MCRYLFCPLVLLALIATVRADEEDGKKDSETAASPEQQYQALSKEFMEARRNYSTESRKAKTQEERQKLFTELYPRPEKFAGRFTGFNRAGDNVGVSPPCKYILARRLAEHRQVVMPGYRRDGASTGINTRPLEAAFGHILGQT